MRLLRSLAILLVAAAPAAAQSRLARDAEVRAAPDGNVVAELEGGTSWRTGTARGGWTVVTIEGWVSATRFAGRRDSFPESIGGSSTLRIREQPSLNGRILGEFRPQAGLRIVERRGTWARVRRDAWVRSSSLAAARNAPARADAPARPAASSAAATGATAPAGTPTAEGDSVAGVGSLRTDREVPLRAAPTGDPVGSLDAGAVVQPVARDRGMVRVRLEAWVPESLLVPADSSFDDALTAADLRLDPDAHKGRLLRWTVQVVGLQRADVLRRDLADGEPYLLAMGPGSENAVLYIAVPPTLLEEARAIPALARVLVTARVRNGRAEPTGTPVLELVSFARR